MRQFAWYSPEINVIILQTFMEGCDIAFEWDLVDMIDHLQGAYVWDFLWIPLGEL